jgi:hypothetical protein
MRRLPLILILCAGCGASIPHNPSAKDVSGTYKFLACDGQPCEPGSSNVYSEGIVVLANEPLTFHYVSTRTMERLSLDADQRNPRINGCFAVHTRRKDVTILGQLPAGPLHWERDKEGVIHFYLFYEPAEKAEYEVVATIDDKGVWQGAGKWTLRSTRLRHDYLYGARTGPADAEPCREPLDKRYQDELR